MPQIAPSPSPRLCSVNAILLLVTINSLSSLNTSHYVALAALLRDLLHSKLKTYLFDKSIQP